MTALVDPGGTPRIPCRGLPRSCPAPARSAAFPPGRRAAGLSMSRSLPRGCADSRARRALTGIGPGAAPIPGASGSVATAALVSSARLLLASSCRTAAALPFLGVSSLLTGPAVAVAAPGRFSRGAA